MTRRFKVGDVVRSKETTNKYDPPAGTIGIVIEMKPSVVDKSTDPPGVQCRWFTPWADRPMTCNEIELLELTD